MKIIAEVRVELKKGVADPEGENTRKALELLGFAGAERVESIKVFRITLTGKDQRGVAAAVEEMCRRLLANPVIHNYKVTLSREPKAAAKR